MGGYQPLAQRYRETAIKTANPLQLVVILYDGAIQALQEAEEHLKCSDIAARARCINRSVSLISELQASLNFQVGGDIANSLDRLYTYMKQRIFRANVEQKAEPLREVIVLLGNLRSAWGELAAQSQGKDMIPVASTGAQPAFLRPKPARGSLNGTLNISG